METIKNMLEVRKEQLLQMKKEKEKAFISAPEGTLRICNHGNKTEYYQRNNPKDFNGTYIREKEIDLVQKLAQKAYDKKVVDVIDKELNVINNFLTHYPEKNAETVYETLNRDRRRLVTPILEPEDEYIQKWENIEYQEKGFDENMPELFTAKGESFLYTLNRSSD